MDIRLIERIGNRLGNNGMYDADAVQVLIILAQKLDCVDRLGDILSTSPKLYRVASFPESRKIHSIKSIRQVEPSLDLKQAKDFVEGVTPCWLNTTQVSDLAASGIEVVDFRLDNM